MKCLDFCPTSTFTSLRPHHPSPLPSPRLYEAQSLPDGLVVLGDSACAFNPVYGQGMTVGILQAKALGSAVAQALARVPAAAAGAPLPQRRAALAGVSQKQMRQLGEVLRFPWAVATGTDAPFLPDFKQSPLEAFIAAYLDEVRPGGGGGVRRWG
jgi:2-polyprenyl-6-methoxyphenol hydroxylase-like FAD-dependent oxidoreductase